jgi:hypothetical protein
MSVKNCEEALRGLGYKKSTELTARERRLLEGSIGEQPGRRVYPRGIERR